jgi:hypothetical protein
VLPLISYIAHPVGDGDDRSKNLDNVSKWFLAIFHAADYLALNVPWKIYVDNLSEVHRERAMRDDLAILCTCRILILVGGKISHGMGLERLTAVSHGLRVLDLTDLGYEAPDLADSVAMKNLASRLAVLLQ